jgi:hypothetical protein
MGFLDKIKQQATDVASTVVEKTQETAKTGQLQMQLRSLKGEEKEALSDLGVALMALGDIPAALDSQAAAVRSARERIAAKEAEIAEVRESDDAPSTATGETVESDAEEVVEAPQASADDSPPV